MPRNNQRGRNNNNPEGHNQHTGWMDTARERPIAAAAVAAATVGAGVFLWSRRSQITEQLSNISDQIGEWTENMGSSSGSSELETVGGGSSFNASAGTGSSGSSSGQGFSGGSSGSSTSGMSEIGGGNASLGKHSGGGGMAASSPKGRGRA